MGQPKLTPLAAAIRAAEPLSDEEKQTLRDVLRPAPKPRQKAKGSGSKSSQKRKAGAVVGGTTSDIIFVNPCAKLGCGKRIDDNIHQLKTDPRYHEFVEPAGEASKGVGA